MSSLIYIAELKSATTSLTSGLRVLLGKKQFLLWKILRQSSEGGRSGSESMSVWKWQIAKLAAYDMHGDLGGVGIWKREIR